MNDSEPKDICCVCNAVGEYGSMQAVNEVDFELLCDECKGKRCNSCDNLRPVKKFDDSRYCFKHKAVIEKPKQKVCDHWEMFLFSSTVRDYSLNV